MLYKTLDRVSFWSLFVTIVLLPIFFLPFTKIPIDISKGLLLVVGLAVSIIFWTAARFMDGKIILPKSWILISGFGIVLAFLLSALFSPVLKVSFFGTMLDVGTFWFMLAAFLLMLVSSVVLRDSKNAKMVFWGVVVSSSVLVVFQILRLLIPGTLSMGILGGKTDNILGSWNALGIFSGFAVIVSVFILEFFSISKIKKWLLGALILLSILLIAAVNFSLIWGILGIFSLILFVYKISFSLSKQHAEGKPGNFPIVSFAIIMVSLLFFMSGQFIGGFLPNRLAVSNLEVRPSFSSTMSIAKDTLAKNPILGAGPNRFAEMWDMYKSASINSTLFWDTSFSSGMGDFPTFAVTTGILGIIAVLLFLVLLLIKGVKSFFYSQKNSAPDVLSFAFFVGSVYFFTSAFFYSTGTAIFLLGFAFVGVFIGLSSSNDHGESVTISVLDDPRKSFFSILFFVFIMIASASVSFKYIERFVSVPYFQKTLLAQNLPDAESNIAKAISLHQNDLYFRTYSQVYLAQLSSLASKGPSISDSEKADLQASFDQAVSGAKLAEVYDQTNYLNFSSLGLVYDAVAPLGIKGAYENAIAAYKAASALNPLNPGLKLALARESFNSGNVKDAKDYANAALSLKPDYINALLILSQIAKSEGNNADALSYAEVALSISPQSSDLAQYVDSLKNQTSPAPVVSTDISNSSVKPTKTKK